MGVLGVDVGTAANLLTDIRTRKDDAGTGTESGHAQGTTPCVGDKCKIRVVNITNTTSALQAGCAWDPHRLSLQIKPLTQSILLATDEGDGQTALQNLAVPARCKTIAAGSNWTAGAYRNDVAIKAVATATDVEIEAVS